MKNRGFTLIELLVVISIIALLAATGLATYTSASKRARDARKIADLKDIQTALYSFYTDKGYMPANYMPGYGVCTGSSQFNSSMQELVTAGYLLKIPEAPAGGYYCYYNYGPDNAHGAYLITTLEAAGNTTTGIPPSCRLWAPDTNWCSQSSNPYYCLCNIY